MNSRIVRFLFGTTIALMIALLLLVMPMPTHAAGTASTTYTVNSMLDEPEADPLYYKCVSFPSGVCTLRAAIMQANFDAINETIIVPAGTYMLTRPGYDNDALVGDLDIAHDVTIQGAGSGATIIDGNGSVTKDRVFKILSSATQVTMTGMAIRNGLSLSSTVGAIGGGGLYIEGSGKILLSDVIFDSNTGQNGGGIYANFSSMGGSIQLNNVILHANTAIAGGVGAGGGAFIYLPSSSSQATIQDSTVYSNTADGTGGGLYVDGNTTTQWSIQRTELYSNTAQSGGAIGNFVPLTLSDSRLHNNSVSVDGGAMEAFAPFSILRTTLDGNSAARFGGAIFGFQTSGSGMNFAHIEQSTLSGNSAQYGGGIYHDGFITPGSLMTLLNSTLSGNTVFRPSGAPASLCCADGGGIYIYGGQAQLLNATVASNVVNPGFGIHTHPARGGGMFITYTATFTGLSSIIANNVRSNGIAISTEDDCFTDTSSGPIMGTLAYDLILTTANCFVSGPQVGNIVGQDPLLGPLQNNGGTTQTRALLPGSPAIDQGAMTGCTDDLGNSLATDQRGFPRPANGAGTLRCDIGAFEVQRLLYLPLIVK